MLKKITAVISNNKQTLGRSMRIVGGVVLGIGVGLLLNKPEEPDVLIFEEIIDGEILEEGGGDTDASIED